MTKMPSDYLTKCYAGWLGKVIGVRHGAPIEGWDYQKICRTLGEIDGYLVDYREFAADDDTNGPMFFLRALDDTPLANLRDITAEQIGHAWLNYASFEHGMYWWGGYGKSSEHTAYLNLRAGIPAPVSGSVEQNGAAVAEQIGGQIFIDTWGLICPNAPSIAAEFAQKAASVSHGGNGVYGGMMVAATIAAAFSASSARQAIEEGLATIPEDCEYTRMSRDILAFFDQDESKDWRSCMEHIMANWGYDRYPGNCHIIPNAAVMIMSMVYGDHDFDRAINICNMAGWDTDCNVGNIGTIMGLLVGLEGIDYKKWRAPINDFLAASSVVGHRNILDLPGNVRTMARLAYKIADEQPQGAVADFLHGARFSFELPGSTHAFRAQYADKQHPEILLSNTEEAANAGQRSLKAVFIHASVGEELLLFHRTYYRPEHFHDNRYEPCFSPLVYPGTTVTAYAMAPAHAPKVRACLYALDSNSGTMYRGEQILLAPGQWSSMSYKIPAMAGACIEQIGLAFLPLEGGDVVVYVDDVDFSNEADYTLDFSKERNEVYTTLHREVSQTTYLKGIWDLENGKMAGSCADFGECYTGSTDWTDTETTCVFSPQNSALCGFVFRVQGAIRSYSVALEGGMLSLSKNELGTYRILSQVSHPCVVGTTYTMTAKAIGNTLQVFEDNHMILSFTDEENPYRSGMVGMRVEGGGRCLYTSIAVKTI